MNTSIRMTQKRQNKLFLLILASMKVFYSYSRLLLEVFIRKDMGIRYFTRSAFYSLAGILMVMPTVFNQLHTWLAYINPGFIYDWQISAYKARYISWYVFVAFYLIAGFFRLAETKRLPSQPLIKPTDDSGDSIIFDISTKVLKWNLTPRRIETLIEPGLFLIIGYILYLFSQSVGTLLMFASVCYSLSYFMAYKLADEKIYDDADKILSQKLKADVVVGQAKFDGEKPQKFHSDKPKVNVPLQSNSSKNTGQNDEPLMAN